MKSVCKIIQYIIVALFVCQLADASPILYTDRTTFDAANGILPTETFENNNGSDNSVYAFSGPLNSTTNNGTFDTGDILPGISLESVGSDTTIALHTQGYFGAPSDVVGPNTHGNDLRITFSSNPTAVGMDILTLANFGDGTFTVAVYTSGMTLLSSSSVTTTGATPVFFGINSGGPPITSITTTFLSGDFDGEFVDNIAFGTSAIPEPTSLLLLGTGLGILWLGVNRRKRK